MKVRKMPVDLKLGLTRSGISRLSSPGARFRRQILKYSLVPTSENKWKMD